jgi:hypothetical protein
MAISRSAVCRILDQEIRPAGRAPPRGEQFGCPSTRKTARPLPDNLMPEIARSASRGFTWRYKDATLFLPHGSELRMRYKDRYHYATVVGDEIQHEGAAVSPAAFARRVTVTSRNAWKDLWVKRPDDREWRLADDCRRKQQTIERNLDEALGPETKIGLER